MNTMNMPGFTAEDSLYKTNAHYQTGRHGINSSTQMIGTIHVAATNVPGEVIVIVEQWPPDPWTPPSWEGHGTGAPISQFRDGGGGGGGSGDTRPPKPPPVPHYNPAEGRHCNAEKGTQGTQDWSRVYTGSYKKIFGNWACCAGSGGCITCPDKPRFGESVHFCRDGHTQP